MDLKKQEAQAKQKQLEFQLQSKYNHTPAINKRSRQIVDKAKRSPLCPPRSRTPNQLFNRNDDSEHLNDQFSSLENIMPFSTNLDTHFPPGKRS